MLFPVKKLAPLVFIGAAIIASSIYIINLHHEEHTDDAFITGQYISVSSKIPGTIKTISFNDNQWINEGDPLFELDDSSYSIKKDKALASIQLLNASLKMARYALDNTKITAPSNQASAQAQTESTKALWHQAQTDLKRLSKLPNQHRSQEQFDHAIAMEKSAFANYQDAMAHLKSSKTTENVISSAKTNIEQLESEHQQALLDLKQADLDLSYTHISAPFSGKIINRSIDIGSHIETGQSLAALIGQNLWVIAYFKETQLKRIKPGQKVIIRIDAYPDLSLTGHVDSIQSGTGAFFSPFPPQNSTGNFVKVIQRVPVKIVFDRPIDKDIAIGPGMSVEPTIFID